MTNIERDRLLSFLLGWLLFTAALPTLIVYRAALQPKYQWGLYGVMGQGMSAAFFIILGTALLAWTAVVLGSLGARPPFAALLVTVNALWFVSMVIGALRLGSRMTVRGDAWGVRVNVAIIGPLLFGALLLLSIRWWWTRRCRPLVTRLSSPSRMRNVLLGAALALTPIIVVLFASGDGVHHTDKDRVAVVCVIAQCLFLGAGLRRAAPTSDPVHIDLS